MLIEILSIFTLTTAISNVNDSNSNSDVFTKVYSSGEWGKDANGQGTSGTGSSPENAKMYVRFLKDFLKTPEIKSVVDLGCGDWQISRLIKWNGIQYTGIDVVENIINKNTKAFSSSNIKFIKADGVNYNLPKADVLTCKDVLQHLPFEDIFKIIEQFPKFKYCIITNDVDPETLTCINHDIPRGSYRTLDLTKEPFNLNGKKVLSYISSTETKQILLINNLQK